MTKEYRRAFDEAYATLNSAQREAVDAIEGPVVVIAGPGTGKTQILALRIANILQKTDTAPESILALTFTESAARAMRARLLSLVGPPAYRVAVFTFHGFADRLIRDYPESYARIIGGRAASDLERLSLIEEALADPAVTLLRPIGAPDYYLVPLASEIAELKREYVAPEHLAELMEEQEAALATAPRLHEKGAHKGKVRADYAKRERELAKNRELLVVYRGYEAGLRTRGLYDFEDMIGETIRALEADESMLRDLQETYQYVLADEHQDVNGGQNRILELLASYHESPNLFVVGDEKQAIFRFQGASLENFLYFEERFRGATTIALVDNYRSGQRVLDLAQSLIEVEDGPLVELRVPLLSATGIDAHVERRSFSHQAVEDTWLVDAVAALVEGGVPPEEIAIIVRTNREVEAFAAHLRDRTLAARASAESDALEHPLARAVLDLIDVAVAPENEEALFRVLSAPYWEGVHVAEVVRVLRARTHTTPLYALIADTSKLEQLGVEESTAISRVSAVLEAARGAALTMPPHRAFEQLLADSGLLSYALATAPLEGGRIIRRLYDSVESMVASGRVGTLAEVSRELRELRRRGLSLAAPYLALDRHAVVVTTAHKAKGLEFSHVFIPHLTDRGWGGRARRRTFDVPLTERIDASVLDPLDDERRLLYVALTRAKEGLYLSESATDAEGKELSPSRLLAELEENLIDTIDITEFEENFVPTRSLAHAPGVPVLPRAFFLDVLTERGFSATSFNNYLQSPWTWVFRNALRIPEVKGLHLQYGTALHGVLERAMREYTATGALPEDGVLERLLAQALGRLPLHESEYTQLLKKGSAALRAYRAHIADTLPPRTHEELTLRVSLKTSIPELPELPLSGTLDRLDLDAEGHPLRVIDYKTGTPKSRGVIEGRTKNSDGDYKRQLVFYALLLSLAGGQHAFCREFVLSFVEPDKRGRIVEELFAITDEEVETLKVELIAKAREIIAGDFLAEPCDPERSDYCDLAASLRSSVS